tara:strand:+ start:226 stop:918 length:693 start_codon:yes stop_codon:yes gene_type:complete
MGKSKDLASGNSAAYVETAGDTMSGDLIVNNQVRMTHDNSGTDAYINLFLSNPNTSSGIRMTGSGNVAYELQSQNDGNFALYDRTTGAYRIKVDSSGRVTKPNTPRFFGHSPTGYNTASVLKNFTSLAVNTNSGFNNSTGTFTAPVAGTYLFMGGILVQTGTGRAEFHIQKNGSTPLVTGNGTGTVYDGPNAICIADLAVNDYVKVVKQSGTAYADGAHSNSYFGGYLLG